jgi:hypothetical protein
MIYPHHTIMMFSYCLVLIPGTVDGRRGRRRKGWRLRGRIIRRRRETCGCSRWEGMSFVLVATFMSINNFTLQFWYGLLHM